MDDAWRMPVLCMALFLPELVFSAFGDRTPREKGRPTLRESAAHLATALSQATVLAVCLQSGWWIPREVAGWMPAPFFVGLILAVVVQRVYARWHSSFSVAEPQRAAVYLRGVAAGETAARLRTVEAHATGLG